MPNFIETVRAAGVSDNYSKVVKISNPLEIGNAIPVSALPSASSDLLGLIYYLATDGHYYIVDIDGVWRKIIDASERLYGAFYVSSAAATTLNPGTPVKVAGTTTATFQVGITAGQNRITNTSGHTEIMHQNVSISVTASVNNILVSFYTAKNGTPLVCSKIDRFIATGADVGAVALSCTLELANNEYFEIFVDGDKAGNVTVLNMNVSAIN